MNEEKPIIFVSHAASDSDIASKFKQDIERSFLGLCELFVSSNLDSLQGGKEWMQAIKENLSKAKIFIGLLSPAALSRPWIYTEFGAGWIRDIPTISVCHSGLDKGQLPVPLSLFQALNLTDELHLEHLYTQISSAIGCQKPERNLLSDTESYFEITEVYRKKRSIQQWLNHLREWNPEFDKVFNGEIVEVLIPGDAEAAFREFKREMESNRYLRLKGKGFTMGSRVGMHASNWEVESGENFEEFKRHAKHP
jgi:hypothetical protein